MSFGARSRAFGGLAALLLMASVRGGHLEGAETNSKQQFDLKKNLCHYCEIGNLMACNDSVQEERKIQCDTCNLGFTESLDDTENFTKTAFDSGSVCLLKGGIASVNVSPQPEGIQRETAVMDHLDESIPTGVSAISDLGELDYPSDQPSDPDTSSFPSEVTNNTEELPSLNTKAIECFSCDSSSDEACLSDADTLQAIKCDMPSECLTVFIDGNIVRNCSSSFSDRVLEFCNKPDTTSCRRCQTAKCNKMPWSQCLRCGPSDGLNCTLSSSIPTEVCPNYDDECSVRITASGDTVRECSPPDTACPPGEICSSCSEPLCNSGIFPANRSRCIQCFECQEKQDPKTAIPCTRYSAEEKCFSYLTPKSKMIRGCASDVEGKLQCEANAPTCVTCNDRDGCNDMPLMKDPSLSCHKCNSKIDAGCAWAQLPKTLGKCQNKVLFYLKEMCMMEFDPKSQVAVRACSFDQGSCTPEDVNCRTCSVDGCNSGNLKVQECIQCSSDAPGQANCAKLAQGIPSTKCPQVNQPYQGRGCFTMTRGNVTRRGCIVGLTPEDVKFCTLEGQLQCSLCTDDGCNNRLAPSGAGKAIAMPMLLLIWAVFVMA